MVDPFHWYGVVETPAFFALAAVDSRVPDVDPDDRMEIRYKPEETPITLAAKKSYAGRAFLDWAKYPITETEVLEPPEEGYIVHFQDLRYVHAPSAFGRDRGRRVLGVGVKLDKNLRVVGDVYDAGQEQVVEPDRAQR
jgi:inner membrane protein